MEPLAPPPPPLKDAIAASLSAVVSVPMVPVPHNGQHWLFCRLCLRQWPAGPAVFALALKPTMLAVAGPAVFALALKPTVLAVAGPAVFAPVLTPTMLAGAGPAVFALPGS
jgi:hypothetical protein